MTQNMTYNMRHQLNISILLRRFSRRALIALALLLTTAGVKARDYVLTWTSYGITYYVGMNGNNIAVKTVFDPTCIWTCYNGGTEANLGNTSYSLRNKINNTYYLTTTCTRSGTIFNRTYTWSALTVRNSANNIWRSSSSNGGDGNVYARENSWGREASIFVQNDPYAWAMQDNNTNGSQNYQVNTNTDNNNLVDNTTLPTISISGTNDNTITFSHTDLTGTYRPGYTIYTFNGTDHFWYDNTDHTVAPTASTPSPTYRWSIASGASYATINSNTGVLTLGENVTGNITVRLNVENLGSLGNKTVDFVLTGTHHDETVNAVGEISTPTVSPTSHTFNYGERQTYTASATATVATTTTPAYTTLTGGGNTYYYYNGTLNAAAPTASAPVETHPTPTFSWVLSGDVATGGYLTPATASGTTITLSYNKISTSEVTGTVTVTASVDFPGVAPKTATASVTATKTTVSGILVYPESIIVGVGGNRQFTYTLQPLGIDGTVTVASGSTSIATTTRSDNTVTVHGVAPGTTNITLSVDGTSLTTTVHVTVVEQCATPTITITPASGGSTANVTLSTATGGATIYYTTDGSTPTTSSNNYTTTGAFSINSGQTVNAIAVKTDYRDSEVTTATYSPDKVATPTINNTSSGVTFACATTGVTYYYTTDGSEPTLSSTQWNGSAITGITDGATIKVIAAHADMLNSDVASYLYHPASAANGTIVTINDAEDHRWSYYSDPECPIRSLNPADVKITYYGDGIVMSNNNDYTAGTSNYVSPGNANYVGGAKVNVGGENENTFIYYKTLERGDATQTAWTFSSSSQTSAASRCPYTPIPNPFQVRPTYGSRNVDADDFTGWRGFQCWRLKSVTGGAVYSAASGGTALAVNAIVNAETDIYFAPNSEYGMEVEFEAVWARAYLKKGNSGNANAILDHGDLGVERNFMTLTQNQNYRFNGGSGRRITNVDRAVTISCYYPNGEAPDGTSGVVTGNNNNITLGANTKFENVTLSASAYTLTSSGYNVIVGRGCTSTNVGTVRGLSADQTNAVEYTIRLESGTYGTFALIDNTARTFSSTVSTKAVFGSDYDRAKGDNNKLSIAANNTIYGGDAVHVFSSASNRNNLTYDWLIKSGKVQGSKSVTDANADESIYIGNSGNNDNTQYMGKRRFTMEGGEIASLAGSLNSYGTNRNNYIVNDGDAVEIRIKGGTIRGSVYGAAAYASATGNRRFVFTGGDVRGWIAGGANGTQSDGGYLYGSTKLYIGGGTSVNSNSSTSVINRAVGGNVFGAGCGYGASSNSGQVTEGTTVVVADDAYVERGVYGGGSYGYTTNTSNIHVLGGHVGGKNGGVSGTTYSGTITGGVFGGACQNQGGTVNITMKDGLVEGGMYGGSNATGTISGNVTMQIDGGQVGTSSKPANIHGGGYGQPTVVSGNVDLMLGTQGQTEKGVTVYGDVYGGSALGSVNGTNTDANKHTNVTLNKGDVHGNVYGGALGDLASLGTGHNNVAANVYGTVAVTVNGGSVTLDDKSAGVFGCNNVNGAPQSTVTVTVNGTDAAGVDNVFGGGNHADYNPPSVNYPTVDIKGGTVNNSVFGGGNEADIKGNANVTMTGGTVKNRVFGGGNLGNVGTFNTVTGHASHSGCIGKPDTWSSGGTCNVTISGGTVGDLGDMTMPDDYGYVFGASRGTSADPTVEPDIDFTAYVKNTKVIISGTAFIIGGVYGGSENGHVRENTEVYIQGGQIGCGEGQTAPYTEAQWTAAINAVTSGNASDITTAAAAMPECSHWPYKEPYTPYDLYDATPGGSKIGDDGHTFYGNVFGGGSGYWPYAKQGGGHDWLEKAGWVEGNTYVEVSGGHILTSIYGGNELTDVGGNCRVKMTGGTLGVPRTVEQMAAHPVTCYLFGAGKGDQRLYFTQRTNVEGNTTVEVEGGTIFGSVFGGGEDGHVKGNATITIGKDDHTGPHIGTTGTSYVDGNIFGAGRGFSGDALTSGVVQGNVSISIKGGTMLGSIYGGGRLGSVGTYIVDYANDDYGRLLGSTGDTSHGNITINISGGTIGNSFEYKVPDGDWSQTWKNNNFIPYTEFGSADTDKNRLMHTKGGNVFGGCMGRLYKLDNTNVIHDWPDMGKARKTAITISGGHIKSNVYGGGEMGVVAEGTTINITGGTIGMEVGDSYTYGSVYGGGYGSGDDTDGYSVDESGTTLNARAYAGLVKGNTDIDISSSGSTHIWASVYGGGELASVTGSTDVNITGGEIGKNGLKDNGYVKYGGYRMGNVFGGGKGSLAFPAAGEIRGNATVTISGGNIYHNVYGGGALGSVGTYSYEPGSSTTVCAPNTGTTTVTITGSAIIGINGWDNGMVNGSSRGGDGRAYLLTHPLNEVAWVNESFVNIGTDGDGANFSTPHIKGSIYGGGENGHNYSNTTINIFSGHVGTDSGTHEHGNIYGAGCGVDTYEYDADGNGTLSDDEKSFYNPLAGIIHGNSYVNIKGGKIERDVYGAGSMGTTEGNSTVTITGGRINRNVFGGPKGKENARSEVANALLADVGGNSQLVIEYPTTPSADDGSTTQLIVGSAFGGGEAGPVKGNVTVNMKSGLVLQDLYGGGALANTNIDNVTAGYGTNSETIPSTSNKKTQVNLTGGTINGNVYGGGLGRKSGYFGETSDLKAKVYGNVTVELNKTQASNKCWVKGNIFGCNNLNGTPKGHALVHIYKTVTKDGSDAVAAKPAKNTNTYELAAVYGGGNMAAYEPVSNTDFAEVIIDGCDYTSIETVYGGGNAASTPATKVTVNSTYEIGTIFGGGNGKDALPNGTATPTPNPGADVGYITEGTTTTSYGSGNANVNALGGMIHKVFGGSNTKGNVRHESVAFIDQSDDTCPLQLDEVYGGGNEAFMDGGSSVKLGCVSYLKNLYGGANDAPVGGNVELTVTSGRFERVFGGNNQGGTISGAITVNIEETGCHPIIIGELYGCGNQAPFGDSSNPKSPTINVKSFTSIGRIFGGGLGEPATVTGNPTVNINEVIGDNSNSGLATGTYTYDVPTYFDADGNFKGWTIEYHDDASAPATVTSTVEVPNHEKGKMGAIGTVFGGGNAAMINGSTAVNINTVQKIDYVSTASGESEPRKNITVLGADIRGNVFGGGNAAKVTGNNTVTIGQEKQP